MWGWIKKALGMSKIIPGTGSFHWSIQVDGNDLLILNVWGTAFGGSNDPQDDGQTSSGVSTKLHPFIMGVALPMSGYGLKSLQGSPIPHMPFGVHSNGQDRPDGAHVVIQDVVTGKQSPVVPVIDLGPSGYTGNAIDMSVALAKTFDPHATANNFKRKVNVRILNAARYVV
jgi:hypothetical protein